jgi:hypothetical protein
MRKMISSLAFAASITACATVPMPSTAAIDRAQVRYDRAKLYAELFLPYLPADRAARIRRAGQLAERALAAARVASSLAEQRAALARADAAMDDLGAEAGARPAATLDLRP